MDWVFCIVAAGETSISTTEYTKHFLSFMLKMNGCKLQSYCCFVLFSLAILNGVVQGPYKDGDVILGGLLTVHFRGESEKECGELDFGGLNRVLAMIFAIEKINNDSNLLLNISIGYDIRDYCEISLKATRVSYDIIKDKLLTNITQGKLRRKSMPALIGPDDSSTAVVIAGLLQALNISAISPTATSSELSGYAYQYMYRTAPSDAFKGKAMADLIEYFKWSYVAAVGQDDTYGRNGLWSVLREAEARNNSFCLAMTTFIPQDGRILSIRNFVTSLSRRENIRVVILWLYGSYAKHFFDEVYRQNLTGRVWILSDVLVSDSIPGFSSVLDGSIVVKPQSFSADTEFEEHKSDLHMITLNQIFPEWWNEIKALIIDCSENNGNPNSMEQCFHDFVQGMQSSYAPYVIDAGYSLAHALNTLAENTTVKDIDYKLKPTMDINVMKSLFSRVAFVGLTGNVSFDEDGDVVVKQMAYDIVNFQQVVEGDTKGLRQVLVGKWKEDEHHAKRLHFFQYIHWNTLTGQPPKSECMDQCPAGTRKSITSPCCWNCVACAHGTVNPIPGLETCIECPMGKKSNEVKTHCVNLPVANLKYSSAGGIVILVFTIVGIIATLSSFAVTCRFWNTPIVKASNRKFSIVLQISILLLLILVVTNLFEPSDKTCKITFPLRYLTYNLCLSFLLVKILRISSAFQIPIARSFEITHLSNRMQGLIIIFMHILLLLVLLPWQLLDPPIKKEHILTEQYIFIECKAYSLPVGEGFFLAVCSYILIQILFSAFCSFRIRKVPENFSEAKRMAFSMYIFSFSVLVYYPVEFALSGWYLTVIDCVTTLLNAYGFICFILLPKIYIIWFRPELNNSSQIRNEVTQFSFELSSALRIHPKLGPKSLAATDSQTG